MQLKSFIASVPISIALALFIRFSIATYTKPHIHRYDDIESAWIVGAAMFIVVKSIQLAPLMYRLGAIEGVDRAWLIFAAWVVTPIDIILAIDCYPWLSDRVELTNLVLSIGCAGWSWLVRLLVVQWVGVDRPNSEHLTAELRAFDSRTPSIWRPNSEHLFVDRDRNTPSLLSILTATPVSTILVGEPGTGKTMTASTMARQWVNDKHHVYYIDSKMDEKELSLWTDACTDRYQFDGTLIRDPNEWCRRLLEAFDEFEEFRLQHLGDGMQTICILDELPAVMAAFKSYKPNPQAALNFINRIVNTLPSRNCHILLLAQNPSCTDTLPTGTIGTLKKIVLAKSGSESQLAEWSNLVMMRSVKLETLPTAIRKSPVDRGCYYSVRGEWLPMESWIRDGDYNRDKLSGGSQTTIDRTPEAQPSPVDNLVLEYFSAATPDRAKTLKNLRDSSRLRDRVSSAEIEAALDRLTAAGRLMREGEGWVSVDW